jgi:hypothetical protein
MAEIVELKTRPKAAEESVLERLRDTIKWAEEGEITAIAIAVVNKDGSIGTSWSQTEDAGRLLGSIARLQFRFNAMLPFTIDGEDDEEDPE